jgi:hypothetical protein
MSISRIHADTVLPFALAWDSIVRSSSGVSRTRSMTALAFPWGSGGRPGRLGFFCGFKASKLLCDCRSYRVRRRFDRPNVIIVPQKLLDVNTFLGYNFCIMRKALTIIALLSVGVLIQIGAQAPANPASKGKSSDQPPKPIPSIAVPQQGNSPTLQPDTQQKQGSHDSKAVRIASLPPRDVFDWFAYGANLLLVGVGIGGIIIAACTLKKIERQTQATEGAVNASQLNIQAFINSERPWILVKAEPSKRRDFGWELIATNKGRTPAEVVAQADNCVLLEINASLPDIAGYGKSKIYPAPQIILPEESFAVGEITQYSLCKNDRASITRFRNVEMEGYVYGSIIYRDLLSPSSVEPHETRWCFSILPWEDQGMLLQEHGWGGHEYIRHT